MNTFAHDEDKMSAYRWMEAFLDWNFASPKVILPAVALLISVVPSAYATSREAGKAPTPGVNTASNCSPEQVEANRKIGMAFNSGKSFEELYALMTTDYIQHNPIMTRFGDLNGVEGRDEFKLLNEMTKHGDRGVGPPKPLPGQPATDPLHLIIADCENVFVMRKTFVPDPQHKGEFYAAFDWDAWRIKDGKLAEHWDGVRIPEIPPEILTVPVKELLARPPKPQD